ncbi:MAG: hypothetical protein JNL74_07095 [Fibrobacteres bacterium]|nr:hypothetical protein [Fibrobacterota bacterium]
MSLITKIFNIAVVVSLLAVIGCSKGGTTLGGAIPGDAEKVLLKDLLAEPAKWNGKKVLLHGVVSGQCGSLCDFNLKDGSSVVTVFPEGYELPKLEIGRMADVYALITAGEERVVVSAIGIQFN